MRIQMFFIIIFIILSCTQGINQSTLDKVPDSLPKFDVVLGAETFDGFIFLRKVTDPGAQLMINSKGEVIWYQLSDTTILRPYTPYFESYIALFNEKQIHEITYAGDTLLNLEFGVNGFDRLLHHEIIKDKDNNILSLTKESIPIDFSNLGGGEVDTLNTDGIILLSRNGKKLWHWSLDQVMNPLEYPEINKYKQDWGHANALFIDDDGHYLISWRDFNEIWKIHNQSGKILWKYGIENIENEKDKFYKQHGIHKNIYGDYLLFDNGDARIRKTSRAIGFNSSFSNTLIIELPDSLFTFKQGNVKQFAPDRFLFSSTTNNTLMITNGKGDIIWLAKSDNAFYRAYYLEKNILK